MGWMPGLLPWSLRITGAEESSQGRHAANRIQPGCRVHGRPLQAGRAPDPLAAHAPGEASHGSGPTRTRIPRPCRSRELTALPRRPADSVVSSATAYRSQCASRMASLRQMAFVVPAWSQASRGHALVAAALAHPVELCDGIAISIAMVDSDNATAGSGGRRIICVKAEASDCASTALSQPGRQSPGQRHRPSQRQQERPMATEPALPMSIDPPGC